MSNDGLPTTRRDFGGEFCVILTIDELGLEIDVGSWGCSEGNLAGTYNVRTSKHGARQIDRVGIDHRGRVIATQGRAVIGDPVEVLDPNRWRPGVSVCGRRQANDASWASDRARNRLETLMIHRADADFVGGSRIWYLLMPNVRVRASTGRIHRSGVEVAFVGEWFEFENCVTDGGDNR